MGPFTVYVGGLNSEFTAAVDDKGAPIKDAGASRSRSARRSS